MLGDYRDPIDIDSIEEGDNLIIDLDDDCYWEQAEGEVKTITEYENGTRLTMRGTKGHTCRLEDRGYELAFTGAARGANNLSVKNIYRR